MTKSDVVKYPNSGLLRTFGSDVMCNKWFAQKASNLPRDLHGRGWIGYLQSLAVSCLPDLPAKYSTVVRRCHVTEACRLHAAIPLHKAALYHNTLLASCIVLLYCCVKCFAAMTFSTPLKTLSVLTESNRYR